MRCLFFHLFLSAVLSLLRPGTALANELPEILQTVLQTDTSYQSISCRIDILVDIPGFNMPEKEVELTLERGKKPQIKGEGITILPKHGIIGQYRDFLNRDSQAIPIRENGDTVVYKVVSLDHRSDWVTVDLVLTRSEARIHSMLISTRKSGEYFILHTYGPEFDLFPAKTEIRFEAMPVKLPLKFLGKQEGMEFSTDSDGPVTGRIILTYSQIAWEKAVK